jgi:uncharacterized phage-like protein YoqJ
MRIAATGHRPNKLGGYQEEILGSLTGLALGYLKNSMERPDAVISGMAQGWDTAVALAALDLGLPLLAAVPFDGQEESWPPDARTRYQHIIVRATNVHVVSPGPYEIWKYAARNKWMVDNTDRVVALWDGGEKGGTADCVRAAQKKGLPVDNLWSTWHRG